MAKMAYNLASLPQKNTCDCRHIASVVLARYYCSSMNDVVCLLAAYLFVFSAILVQHFGDITVIPHFLHFLKVTFSVFHGIFNGLEFVLHPYPE